MGKDTFAISAYLKGSVRKCEDMRTQEHKRSVKNGANSNGVKTCAPTPTRCAKLFISSRYVDLIFAVYIAAK